jgi:hypothetical protein
MSPRGLVSSFGHVARTLFRSRGTNPARRRALATCRRPLAAEAIEPRAMLATSATLTADTSSFARIPVAHG